MGSTTPATRGFGASLRAKLYGGFLLVALAGLVVGGILVDRTVRQTATAQVADRLAYEAMMLAQMTKSALFGEIDPTDTSLHGSVRALGDAVHTQLAVIARNGAVVADSDSEAPLGEPSQLDAPEIRRADIAGSGTALRDGRIYVAQAIVSDGKTLGYARAAVSTDVIAAYARQVSLRMIFGGSVAALVALALGYVVSSRIVRPIRALSEGARRVGAGDFDRPIDITTRDEIGELAGAFNDMTRSLRATMARLDARNRDMQLVLDHVDQGLLTLDVDGRISAERSAIVEVWLGPVPANATFWDYVSVADKTAAGMFRCAWEMLIEDVMPFEVSIEQLPSKMAARGRHYELNYTPIHGETDARVFTGMLIAISDVTPRLAAERAQAEQRETVAAFERIMKDRRAFIAFVAEAASLVAQVCGEPRPPLVVVKRLLHTLKGTLAIFGLRRFELLSHELENRMAELNADLPRQDREAFAAAWEQFVHQVDAWLGDRRGVVEVDEQDHAALLQSVEGEAPRAEIAARLASWTLERVELRFQHLAARAKALGDRLEKADIDVRLEGSDLRLPHQAMEPVWTVLTHVISNAVDHGVEDRKERALTEKPPVATIVLRAERVSGDVVIEVRDDGRGIAWDDVTMRARELGLPHETQADLTRALLTDGFSTRAAVSEVSGRGVGLAAVSAECERLGGRMELRSERGKGTTLSLRLPVDRLSVTIRPRSAAAVVGGTIASGMTTGSWR